MSDFHTRGSAARSSGASRVVFALDFPSVEEARARALDLRDDVGMVKVGLELFVEAGPAAVRAIGETGLPIFLDLKLHDIPATVERAVDRALALGARVLTVHAAGGAEMLRRAVKKAEGTELLVTAVTVLTSLDDGDLALAGVTGSVDAQARRLARLAFDQGVRGFVCSPQEARTMRDELGPDATLFTPGVRPADVAEARAKSVADDQKRIATAGDAIRAGADYVVVGRPLRDASEPRQVARALAHDIEEAWKKT